MSSFHLQPQLEAAILGQIWAEYRKKLQLRNVEGVFEVI